MSGSVVERIMTHLNAEADGVRNEPDFDIATSTMQKSRLLAELQRVPSQTISREAALELQAAVRANADELAAQLGAVRQINALITDAMRADLCDGTYGAGSIR
ncbi:MAG: hypothetical protein AAFO70_01875 [Pseudomonadota bacterium]